MTDTYITVQVEASLCLWEAMLEGRGKSAAWAHDMNDLWALKGTVHMRHVAIQMGPWVDNVWKHLTPDQQDMLAPFDWEFVPCLLRIIDWTNPGASLAMTPPEHWVALIEGSRALGAT